jgi:hypothetical protein
MISLADVEKIAQQAAKYHHPHYQGVTKNEYNRVLFTFKPFTGAEEEPSQSRTAWSDDSLPRAAHDFLDSEYEAARDLWREAKYIRELKAAAQGASALWGDYTQARQDMDAIFASLDNTPDNHWRATVSKLIAAQDKALATAEEWDDKAEDIATCHSDNMYSDLGWREAYQRAGIDGTDWVIGDKYDYGRSYYGKQSPVVRDVNEAIEKQREHLRKIASLTGDREG